jgi:hypothetical protein
MMTVPPGPMPPCRAPEGETMTAPPPGKPDAPELEDEELELLMPPMPAPLGRAGKPGGGAVGAMGGAWAEAREVTAERRASSAPILKLGGRGRSAAVVSCRVGAPAKGRGA